MWKMKTKKKNQLAICKYSLLLHLRIFLFTGRANGKSKTWRGSIFFYSIKIFKQACDSETEYQQKKS